MAEQQDTFYKSFSEKKLTGYGSGRRSRIEQQPLALLQRFKPAPGDMVEVGPGHRSRCVRVSELNLVGTS
mgnify:CR=1 FL=1